MDEDIVLSAWKRVAVQFPLTLKGNVEMDYQKVYTTIIENAKIRKRKIGYFEKHHITPKSMGGGNEEENLVFLTAREHFICHKILYKIHRNRSMAFAWHMMTVSSSKNSQRQENKISSRDYENIKKIFSESQTGDKHPMFGKKHTDETKRKISEFHKGKKLSEEHKRKIGKKHKGKKLSNEQIRSIIENNKKTVWTEEKRKNLRTGHKKRSMEILTCPHCGITKKKSSNMLRYHFDNCKQRDGYTEPVPSFVTCPHCGKVGKRGGGMNRYHFDNCKNGVKSNELT